MRICIKGPINRQPIVRNENIQLGISGIVVSQWVCVSPSIREKEQRIFFNHRFAQWKGASKLREGKTTYYDNFPSLLLYSFIHYPNRAIRRFYGFSFHVHVFISFSYLLFCICLRLWNRQIRRSTRDLSFVEIIFDDLFRRSIGFVSFLFISLEWKKKGFLCICT